MRIDWVFASPRILPGAAWLVDLNGTNSAGQRISSWAPGANPGARNAWRLFKCRGTARRVASTTRTVSLSYSCAIPHSREFDGERHPGVCTGAAIEVAHENRFSSSSSWPIAPAARALSRRRKMPFGTFWHFRGDRVARCRAWLGNEGVAAHIGENWHVECFDGGHVRSSGVPNP